MRTQALWNHELDAATRELASSLSSGLAVGVYLATEKGRYYLMPIGAAELLDIEDPYVAPHFQRFEEQAAQEFADGEAA